MKSKWRALTFVIVFAALAVGGHSSIAAGSSGKSALSAADPSPTAAGREHADSQVLRYGHVPYLVKAPYRGSSHTRRSLDPTVACADFNRMLRVTGASDRDR